MFGQEAIQVLIDSTAGGLAVVAVLGAIVAGAMAWGVFRNVTLSVGAGLLFATAALIFAGQQFYLVVLIALILAGGAGLGIILSRRG